MAYRYRYLCQLVNEPQVHRCASTQCDELSRDICLGMLRCHFVPQRPAHCSVERWSLDGQQEWHHVRLTGLRGMGVCGTLFRVHLGSRLSSICWCKSQTQLKVQLSLLLRRMLDFLPQVPTSDLSELFELFKTQEIYSFPVLCLPFSHAVEGALLNIS